MSSSNYVIFLRRMDNNWGSIDCIFFENKNSVFKRKVYPVLVIATSALFGFFSSSRFDFSHSFSWFFYDDVGRNNCYEHERYRVLLGMRCHALIEIKILSRLLRIARNVVRNLIAASTVC